MKSVSLRHMQHHLSDVMRHVDQGQEVLVTRRRRTIARLVPMQPATARVKWPDFAARTTLIKGPPRRSSPTALTTCGVSTWSSTPPSTARR